MSHRTILDKILAREDVLQPKSNDQIIKATGDFNQERLIVDENSEERILAMSLDELKQNRLVNDAIENMADATQFGQNPLALRNCWILTKNDHNLTFEEFCEGLNVKAMELMNFRYDLMLAVFRLILSYQADCNSQKLKLIQEILQFSKVKTEG